MNVRDHLFIVISGDNANALGVVRSLGEAGIKPVLIYLVEESHLPMLIKSRYLNIVHKVLSYTEGVDLLIEKYSGLKIKPFVYSCDDSLESIIDNRFEELINDFYFFNAGGKGKVSRLMDKSEICRIAESCGFRAPKYEVVKKGELPKSLSYPVVTKTLMSIMGAWKADSFVCNDEKELLDAYKNIVSDDLIIEEYIEKKNELAVEGFSINGGQEVYIPYSIRYIRFSSNSYGHYMHCDLLKDDCLLSGLKSIMEKCHYSGCFEVEFLIDKDDRLWFLEVNFRFSLWNYALTFGGINYPLFWAESTLANSIPPSEASSSVSLPLKSSFTAINEPGDFSQVVQIQRGSLLGWLKDVWNADMCYVYNPRDKNPCYSFWSHKLFKKFRRGK